MDFITFLIGILVRLILIVGPIVAIYLILKIRKTSDQIQEVTSKQYTLLRILVPKQNEKTPLAAEEMFASIHGIFRADQAVQDHLSFEIASRDQYIQFFAYVPTHLKDFVEGQIYAQYPTVEISEVQDYTDVDLTNWSMAAAELVLTQPDYFPIKTFNNFQVDPLAGITSVLSKIDEGEQIWIQVLTRPVPDVWQEKTLEYVKMVQDGKKPVDNSITISKLLKGTASLITELAKTAVSGAVPEKKEDKKEKPSLPGPVQEGLKAAETKTTKLGFETVIRVAAIAKDDATATSKINNLVGAFKQYNVTNMNGFSLSKVSTDKQSLLPLFKTRAFPSSGYIFNVEELASIYHLPSQSVETPSIVWAGAKKGEPPANLPIEGLVSPENVTLFAKTNYRHFNHRFGIKNDDRRYHMYAIGKTGTGKSTMLRNMIIDDIQKGRGICVVDPHGDLIQHCLNFIPDHRVEDIVYFNPADREHPVGFNLLESVDPDLKSIVASGLMSIFTKLWANVWSARMEYILRNAVLALLEYPNATLLEIMKLLVDPVFRRKVLYHVKDPVIRDFFINEYEKYDPKFRTEAIAPIQNKVGQFLSSSTIRNIMGQIHSTIDMREIMDSGKILLVDLSVGKIGEDNAALLGSMIITKIQLAAMGRADTPEDQRRDFYLYVDEFQNFATESFAVILSEARKYHLNLIITHQYIAQMPEVVASAVFGNVGTIVAFRIGASDAGALEREFEPVFNASDLVNLDNYHVYLKMAIDARTAAPFSAVTLPPFLGRNENRDKVIQRSIDKYTAAREVIEKEIEDRNEANSGKIGTLMEVDGEIIYQEELKPYEPMNPLPKNEVVGGVDLWKIRDQEGKPFYVAGPDYDSYMQAKGKASDRPGASTPTAPVVAEEDLVDPESKRGEVKAKVPVVSQSSPPKTDDKPQSDQRRTENEKLRTKGDNQPRRSEQKGDSPNPVISTRKEASADISVEKSHNQSAIRQPSLDNKQSIKVSSSAESRGQRDTSTRGSDSRLDIVHQAQNPGESDSRVDSSGQLVIRNEQSAMAKLNIVRHKNEEKNTEIKPTESAQPTAPSAVEQPEMSQIGELQEIKKVEDLPVVTNQQSNLPTVSNRPQQAVSNPADFVTVTQQNPQNRPVPPETPQNTDTVAAKFNDFDPDDYDDTIPVKEL